MRVINVPLANMSPPLGTDITGNASYTIAGEKNGSGGGETFKKEEAKPRRRKRGSKKWLLPRTSRSLARPEGKTTGKNGSERCTSVFFFQQGPKNVQGSWHRDDDTKGARSRKRRTFYELSFCDGVCVFRRPQAWKTVTDCACNATYN